jgi:predicted transcriptional regulator
MDSSVSLASVVRQLELCKGTWRQVSVESGVPYETLSKVARGKTKNPRISTVEALHLCLRRRALT